MPEIQMIPMHEYACLSCGFRWFQERFFGAETCIRCGRLASYMGRQWREQEPPCARLVNP